MTTSLFVSYRRDDAAAEASLIARFAKERIGEDSVFFDTSSISPGETWPVKLREKIQNANIVVAVIGPQWVRIADQWGKRRLDDPNDWVRKEIETAISSGVKLLPVLVGTARMPPPEVLPESLQQITTKQAIELRRDYWDHDIQLLLAQLAAARIDASENPENNPFPTSPYMPPDPIDEEKLGKILDKELPGWSQIATPLPTVPGKVRVEITRTYKFNSFQAAINFMAGVAPGCDIAMHHPRWENIWKTVAVYLSTWDGSLHRVTDRDVTLARYFDSAYQGFSRSTHGLPNSK